MTELRFPPQLPPGALNPTDHSTSAVHGVIAAGAVTCWAAESQEGFDKLPSVGVELGDVESAILRTEAQIQCVTRCFDVELFEFVEEDH